jgi:colicin import membrane protein
MVRKHETAMAWKAGFLALLVHVLLVAILLFSFQWKAAHTVVSVSDVELWNELPSQKQAMPKPVHQDEPKPQPEPLKPEPPKPEPKVEPVPPKPEPKLEPEPKPEVPKVDIELENKKKIEAEKKKAEEKKKLEEQKKKEAEKKKIEEQKKKTEAERQKKLEELQKATRDDVLEANKEAAEKAALEKLQQMNSEDLGSENKKASSAASQGVVDQYIAKIQAKVRGNVNPALCADGNPEPQFRISLLPNGEFSGMPVLTKTSGNVACDDAVERAIIASEPFPLPTDPSALARFRQLNLTFKPNAN